MKPLLWLNRTAPLAAAVMLMGLATACAPKTLDFEPIGAIARVDVNNAVGAFKPASLRDSGEIAHLVDIMNQHRLGWAKERQQTAGASALKCAYGIGFYDKDNKWIGGVSIGADGETVSRAQTQLGTLTVYKNDPAMVGALLTTLRKTLTQGGANGSGTQGIKTISVEQLRDLRARRVPFLLLDVREPSEFATGAIAGAVNIPMGQVERRLGELPTDRKIVVMCHSGRRSGIVAARLNELGYRNAISLSGGIEAWMQRVDPKLSSGG